MTKEFQKLEKEYTIHAYETGPDGRLSLCSLFDYLQDIASDHAVKLGYGREDLLKNNTFWVLSRIYAEISDWPLWSSTIMIKTWPRGTDKLFALRDFKVQYLDGKLIANATSSWLIISQDTRRIQRPDVALSMYNSKLPDEKALRRNAAKLEAVASDGHITNQFSVRISDLDINLHTNNTRYIRWIIDSYGLDFILNNSPLSAEINYLAESYLNDSVAILTSEEKDKSNIFNHAIIRASDNAELCRLRINWKHNHR